ncbi:MAG: ferritin [Candidatus Omnitrophota bacterium]|nr:ferritin [Candidatus Omnitrophota bacterium]MBU1929316.1 ferritin [Candidatus Omnitrophota bacterium]MBU2035608.1 ferritin [Candidatus Omnitrophota bacterium]MBU2221600.1 ferritin [Candidatus Omnitrophota bacterium]
MDKKLHSALNEQIKNELYSAYLYLSMASWFESVNLEGFAHWMKVQAKEEEKHAMKIFDFLNDRGVKVVLQAIAQPPVDFSSAKEIFEQSLGHEKKVTAMINKLYDLSLDVGDHASRVFLHWFINEQVEEEKSPSKILETLRAIKGEGAALIMLDRELAKREG